MILSSVISKLPKYGTIFAMAIQKKLEIPVHDFFGMKKEYLLLIAVLCFAFLIRVYSLGSFPQVVNGDETISILHPFQMMKHTVSIFDRSSDGHGLIIIYAPKLLMLLLFGFEHSLLAVRLVTVLFSVGVLVIFYIQVRRYFTSSVSLLATFLFATSYWFLNFSRISWINVDGLFFGLFFYFSLEKAVKTQKIIWAVVAGIMAGIVLMHYMGIRIYLLTAGVVFLPQLRWSRQTVCLVLAGFISTLIVSLPVINQMLNEGDAYTSRARVVSIFHQKENYYDYAPNDFRGILMHQVEYVSRGFLLFDGKVSSEGAVENKRYMPFETPAVNRVVHLLFSIGFMAGLVKWKHPFFLLTYLLSIVLLQIPTVYVPNWSRAIGILPAIYFFTAYGIDLLLKLQKRYGKAVIVTISTVIIIAGINDIKIYWKFITSSSFLEAQGPALSIAELPAWQKAEFKWIENKHGPFSIYDWENQNR